MSSGAPFADPVGIAVVPGADLVPLAVGNPPTSVVLCGHFSATDTVRNQGIGASGPSTNRYYLSLDTTKGSGDERLTGFRAINGLDPGSLGPAGV